MVPTTYFRIHFFSFKKIPLKTNQKNQNFPNLFCHHYAKIRPKTHVRKGAKFGIYECWLIILNSIDYQQKSKGRLLIIYLMVPILTQNQAITYLASYLFCKDLTRPLWIRYHFLKNQKLTSRLFIFYLGQFLIF